HTYQLQGGYKAYRRFVHSQLKNYDLRQQLIVLNGLTGTGKTEIIKMLSSRWPAIDLEEMARHRGSVFGNLGLESPRSQKDFEALLWRSLYLYRDEPFIFVEGEGRRIGPLFLPKFMVEGIEKGIHILLQASLETRTERILKEYASLDKNLIIEQAAQPIKYLGEKLGREKASNLLNSLYEEDFYTVVKTLCRDYYDRQYNESKIGSNVFELIVDAENLEQSVEEIEKNLEKLAAKKLSISGGRG
ncbi:MAG: tRNA 2-selenouridine synthase, partial [Firmicutes bacterium HGW-Firmicutes-13]